MCQLSRKCNSHQFSYPSVILNHNASKSELTNHGGHVTSSMQCTELYRQNTVLIRCIYTSCSQVQLLDDLLNFLIIKPTFKNQIVRKFPQKPYKKVTSSLAQHLLPFILRRIFQTPPKMMTSFVNVYSTETIIGLFKSFEDYLAK